MRNGLKLLLFASSSTLRLPCLPVSLPRVRAGPRPLGAGRSCIASSASAGKWGCRRSFLFCGHGSIRGFSSAVNVNYSCSAIIAALKDAKGVGMHEYTYTQSFTHSLIHSIVHGQTHHEWTSHHITSHHITSIRCSFVTAMIADLRRRWIFLRKPSFTAVVDVFVRGHCANRERPKAEKQLLKQ